VDCTHLPLMSCISSFHASLSRLRDTAHAHARTQTHNGASVRGLVIQLSPHARPCHVSEGIKRQAKPRTYAAQQARAAPPRGHASQPWSSCGAISSAHEAGATGSTSVRSRLTSNRGAARRIRPRLPAWHVRPPPRAFLPCGRTSRSDDAHWDGLRTFPTPSAREWCPPDHPPASSAERFDRVGTGGAA
jgi:hypothetical protein